MDDVLVQELSDSLKRLPVQKKEFILKFFRSAKLSEEGKNREADEVFNVSDMKRSDLRSLMYTLGEVYLNTVSTSKILNAIEQ